MLMTSSVKRLDDEHFRQIEKSDGIHYWAIVPEEWLNFLKWITSTLDCSAAMISSKCLESGRSSVIQCVGLPPACQSDYASILWTFEDWFGQEGASAAIGDVFVQNDLRTGTDGPASAQFQAWLARHRISNQTVLIIGKDDTSLRHLTLFRSGPSVPFGDRETAVLEDYLPYLHYADSLRNRYSKLENERDATLNVLDQIIAGVLLLDADGNTLYSNRRAQELISPDDRVASSELRRWSTTASKEGKSFAIRRDNGKPPVPAMAHRLTNADKDLPKGSPALMLVVNDPMRGMPSSGDWMRSFFQLTPAETRLANLLAQGESLEQSADLLNISVGTARVHLKRIYSKTGVRRQAELVRMILSGPVLAGG